MQAIPKEDIKFSFLTSILTWQSIYELNCLTTIYSEPTTCQQSVSTPARTEKKTCMPRQLGQYQGQWPKQASETRFHVVSLLLIRRHTALLYLNATFTSFHYLHCKHSRNSDCAADTVSAC